MPHCVFSIIAWNFKRTGDGVSNILFLLDRLETRPFPNVTGHLITFWELLFRLLLGIVHVKVVQLVDVEIDMVVVLNWLLEHAYLFLDYKLLRLQGLLEIFRVRWLGE